MMPEFDVRTFAYQMAIVGGALVVLFFIWAATPA